MATVSHDSVVQKASAADAAIQAAADAAAGQVQAEVAPAPVAIIATVNAAVSDAQAKNADQTTQGISLADTQRAALLNQVQNQVNTNVQSAQQQRDTDAARSLDDLVIAQVNPPPPQSGWQTFIDFFPSWKTVAMVGVGVGLGAVALLVPGVGPVLFAVGMGMLAVSSLSSAADRGFNQGQTVLQSLGGGLADATGVSAAYTGWTGEDLATGRHLGLTDAQQRQMLGESGVQIAAMLLPGAIKGGRNFLRGRQAAAPAARQAGCFPNCFPAGTLISAAEGLKSIETIRVSDRVWAYDLVAKKWKLRSVVETYRFDHEGDSVALLVAGEIIEATAGHPFWVIEGQGLESRPRPEHVPETPAGAKVPGRWVDAGDLQVGDVLLLKSGRQAPVTRLAVRQVRQEVYNFQVEGLHCYAVGTGQVLVHNNCGEGVTLPEFVAGGKTSGVLRTAAGDTPLLSGRAGPAASLPKPSPGFNAITSTHVEGHASALMRQQGIQEAVLHINNPKICLPCQQNLANMLPPGSRLTVVLPDGSSILFIGNAR